MPDLVEYVQRATRGDSLIAEHDEISLERRARERLMTELRLCAGVDVRRFSRETGFSPHVLLGEHLERWRDADWMLASDTTICLSPSAYLISDSLFRDLL